ncbi:MAG: energy transducer TonB [Acidobacteriota bacterium]|nr:energy transducer TonB [Acidobacteriota bacterium]
MKKLFFTGLLFVLCFVGSTFAQVIPVEKSYEFRGVVKDENSAVIAGTSLFFTGNNKSFEVKTNQNGEFSTKLSPEKYEIKINKYISSDFIAFVEIRENALNPNNVEYMIKTNAICCGQTLDKIYPKLLSFPQPPFPPAAKAVRATGEVVVLVKIGKDGKVISASAESGHPLLKTVSEKAAKNSLFETSENNDEREARLTYVFLNDFSDEKKQNLKHYSNPYRLEIIAEPPTIDVTTSH